MQQQQHRRDYSFSSGSSLFTVPTPSSWAASPSQPRRFWRNEPSNTDLDAQSTAALRIPLPDGGCQVKVNVPASLEWVPPENVLRSLDDRFERMRCLGSGGSSAVYEVRVKQQGGSGMPTSPRGVGLAMKVLSRALEDADEYVRDECAALIQLKHPGVIAFRAAFVTRHHYAIVTEMGHRTLNHALECAPQARFSERKARVVMTALLQTCTWLHSQRVAHRDLKPENIVFLKGDSGCRNPKIVDWADALKVPKPNAKVREVAGTAQYLAPEKYRKRRAWEELSADVWSLGAIAYEILTGRRCFDGRSKEIKSRVLRNEWMFPAQDEVHLSDEAYDFICALLTWDSSKRPTARKCLSHVWITQRPEIID